MSDRTEQILEVLKEVERRRALLGVFRERAVPVVAEHFGVEPRTVHDKLVRQLSPDVTDAVEYDRRLVRWLVGDAEQLRRVLRHHAVGRLDEALTEALFTESARQAV